MTNASGLAHILDLYIELCFGLDSTQRRQPSMLLDNSLKATFVNLTLITLLPVSSKSTLHHPAYDIGAVSCKCFSFASSYIMKLCQ
jgi:hypothetical protein